MVFKTGRDDQPKAAALAFARPRDPLLENVAAQVSLVERPPCISLTASRSSLSLSPSFLAQRANQRVL